MTKSEIIETLMGWFKQRNPGENEFHQADYEVGFNVLPLLVTAPLKNTFVLSLSKDSLFPLCS